MDRKTKRLPGNEITIRSSTAEYLTYVAATFDGQDSFEVRYEDENIWMAQKMMATLYNVSVSAINQHIQKVYSESEAEQAATIKRYLIVAGNGKNYLNLQEMKSLEQIVSAYLELAERRATRQIPMTMEDWAKHLDLILMADEIEYRSFSNVKTNAKI